MSAQKTGLMAFVYGLVGLVIMGGNKSVPKLIQEAAKTTALWAARGYLSWYERQEKPKDVSKNDKASDDAFDNRYSMGTLVRVVRGENKGLVGRVRWDNVHTDAHGTSRRITIMVGDGRHTRAIIEEPGNVALEPEAPVVTDPVGGGGSGGDSSNVTAGSIPPWNEVVVAAIHAAWNVDVANVAQGFEALSLILVDADVDSNGVMACSAELRRMIELDPMKAAYEAAPLIKYTIGITVKRSDGRSVCLRVAPRGMWASLTHSSPLVFFAFINGTTAEVSNDRSEASELGLNGCRARLLPGGVEWGKKTEASLGPAADEAEVVAAVVGGTEVEGDALAVGDAVMVANEHPFHAGVGGNVESIGSYGKTVTLDCSNGGSMKIVTVERKDVVKATPAHRHPRFGKAN